MMTTRTAALRCENQPEVVAVFVADVQAGHVAGGRRGEGVDQQTGRERARGDGAEVDDERPAAEHAGAGS